MAQDKEPAHYEKLLEDSDKLSNEEIQNAIEEVSHILGGIEKGLKVLKKIGREPDKEVLENQIKFNTIFERLVNLKNEKK